MKPNTSSCKRLAYGPKTAVGPNPASPLPLMLTGLVSPFPFSSTGVPATLPLACTGAADAVSRKDSHSCRVSADMVSLQI